MKKSKILLIILAIFIITCLIIAILSGEKSTTKKKGKIQVISSNFASYDFLRAIIGESENVELLLLIGPGKDAHSYNPSAKDLIKIKDSDLFVYVGGELENWANKVLESLDNKSTKVVCISDYVQKIEEKEIEGTEEEIEEDDHEGAFDEHIWTSPANAIKMVKKLAQEMEELDTENAQKYEENANIYISKIQDIDNKIQEIVQNKVRDRLVFADKMPMQYFIDYYNLKVSAAFNGCSAEIEPSAKTIAYLENIIEKEKIPVVLYIELNNGKIAKTIANEVENKPEVMQIQTLHNISLDDFNSGETWVSLMTRNLDVLKKALQ